MSEVAGVVLAAGRGTRFGESPKLLATLDGRALVRHAAEAALAAGLAPVLVVVGHRAGGVEAALTGLPVRIVPNPDYADGLSTSLRAGFAALPPSAAAAAILLGDMPRVSGGLVRRLAQAWREGGEPVALVPVHDGRRGNPAILSRGLAPAIAELVGDSGAGPLLRGRAGVVEFAVSDDAIRLDIDTPEALARLRPAQPASTTP